MIIDIPQLCVVALIGASGSGKSSFARRVFAPTEVASSDHFRALVSDDETNQAVSPQAFDALYHVAGHRLDLGRLTVIDATNVTRQARADVLRLAKDHDCHAVAIVLDIPEATCRERDQARTDRQVGARVIARQAEQLRRSIRGLAKEGFRYVHVLHTPEEIDQVELNRTQLWVDKRDIAGPFDIIGDVHGCYDELCELLAQLGYAVDKDQHTAQPPMGRTAVFVGDLTDRGPHNLGVLRLVMAMVANGSAYCVAGNHDAKLARALRGAPVQVTHGLDRTLAELKDAPETFVAEVRRFTDGLLSHYVFDAGRLVVAHAGLIEKYQGRASGRVRSFCLYGDTTGETDEYGLPVRRPWANDYRGQAMVVYGHTPTPTVEAVNNTYCIDTGCVFGGQLSALRYPEKDIVAVDAAREYYPPARPFLDQGAPGEDLLALDDVTGRRRIDTRLRRAVTIEAENAAAALEVVSRYAADPRWLIYLPPTMSPGQTSPLPDLLEHPAQAFAYYRQHGVAQVVCQRKHMGSRAVITVARDAQAAASRFRVSDGRQGIVHTRTGRPFFDDATGRAVVARLGAALQASGFWDDFATDWVCLDAEVMPWSAKAGPLIDQQYAPVGQAGRAGLARAAAALEAALARGVDTTGLDLGAVLTQYRTRADDIERYIQAYSGYCWEVAGVDDLRIAAFHLLASQDHVWCDQTHLWHLETIARYLVGADPLFATTDHLVVDLGDEASVAAGTTWWSDLTAAGGEGMVVKPFDFIATDHGQVLQPALKCRGPQYLRLIYGPEYRHPDNLARLKQRSLGRKRALALGEFALGIEALERFVAGEALHRVHECVFGVLALESEPVDPRL
jgi:protein phosphatase